MTFFNPSRACLMVKVIIRIFLQKPSFAIATHTTSLKTSFQAPFGRVRNGSLSIWSKEGEREPPHLVMPITVEPSTPRMFHDKTFLNLWMKTPSVTFDPTTNLPRYVDPKHCQSKQSRLDDKSGYDHFLLSEDSRTLFWVVL